jgi:hypothetical protein
MDPAVAAECPPIVQPEDIASIGQPLPPASPAPVQQPAVAAAPVPPPGAPPALNPPSLPQP